MTKPVKSTDYPPRRVERHWVHEVTPESSAQDALIDSLSRRQQQEEAAGGRKPQTPERDSRTED